LSTQKLKAVCQKSVGSHAQAIIWEWLILEAKNLLCNTNDTTTQIADQL